MLDMYPFPSVGGHIVFSVDPVHVGVGVQDIISKWANRNQICMDITFGHEEDLIKFW